MPGYRRFGLRPKHHCNELIGRKTSMLMLRPYVFASTAGASVEENARTHLNYLAPFIFKLSVVQQ